MTTTLASVLVMVTEGEEAAHELPLSPLGFGLVTLTIFAALFGLTWIFRNVARKR